MSSEVELHCVGSLWGPAVRNKPFCTITRSMSQSHERWRVSAFGFFFWQKVKGAWKRMNSNGQGVLRGQMISLSPVWIINVPTFNFCWVISKNEKDNSCLDCTFYTFSKMWPSKFLQCKNMFSLLHLVFLQVQFRSVFVTLKNCFQSCERYSDPGRIYFPRNFWFYFQIDVKREAVTLHYGDLKDSVPYPNPAVFHNNAN